MKTLHIMTFVLALVITTGVSQQAKAVSVLTKIEQSDLPPIIKKLCIDLNAEVAFGKAPPALEGSEKLAAFYVDTIMSNIQKKRQSSVGGSSRARSAMHLYDDQGQVSRSAQYELARRIVEGRVPRDLRLKTVLLLNRDALLKEAKNDPQRVKQLMQSLLREVEASKGKYILAVNDAHHYVSTPGETIRSLKKADFGDLLPPFIENASVDLIGGALRTEFNQHTEKEPEVQRLFRIQHVKELQVGGIVEYLEILRPRLEKTQNIEIAEGTIDYLVKSTKRYLGTDDLLGKSQTILDLAIANFLSQSSDPQAQVEKLLKTKAKLQEALKKEPDNKDISQGIGLTIAEIDKEIQAAHKEGADYKTRYERFKNFQKQIAIAEKIAKTDEQRSELNKHKEALQNERNNFKALGLDIQVSKDNVKAAIAAESGVPIEKMTEDDVERLIRYPEIVGKRVKGQKEAIDGTHRMIMRAKADLKDTDTVMGAALFIGPTGSGKTELAKAIAEFLFGDESELIRIDMGEYMERHSFAKLIGSPPGYAQHEEGGQLTEKVRKKPYAVVLLDEIEKADASVLLSLLAMLDEGRLTDGKGKTVNFKNVFIVMTSNVGSELFSTKMGREEIRQRILEELSKKFTAPFVARLTTFLFDPISAANALEILDKIVERVNQRTKLNELGVELTMTQAAKEYVVSVGLNPTYGARFLRDAFQNIITDQLAIPILARQQAGIEIPKGAKIRVSLFEGRQPQLIYALEVSHLPGMENVNDEEFAQAVDIKIPKEMLNLKEEEIAREDKDEKKVNKVTLKKKGEKKTDTDKETYSSRRTQELMKTNAPDVKASEAKAEVVETPILSTSGLSAEDLAAIARVQQLAERSQLPPECPLALTPKKQSMPLQQQESGSTQGQQE